VYVRFDVIVGTDDKGAQAQEPEYAKEGARFEQLLISQVIAGINLEYEHVVHTRATPAVRINSDAEHVKNDEESASVEFDGDFPVKWEFVIASLVHKR
jgi:hypothetical protein